MSVKIETYGIECDFCGELTTTPKYFIGMTGCNKCLGVTVYLTPYGVDNLRQKTVCANCGKSLENGVCNDCFAPK